MSGVPNMAYGGPIQNWNPKYDKVIALHLAGFTSFQIAEAVGYEPGHVRRVLNDPRVEKVIEAMRKRLMGNILTDIGDRMRALAPGALENIQKTIEAKVDVESKYKRHQDEVSFELLARVGFGKKDVAQEGEMAPQIPKELSDKLMKALENADRAREIKQLPELEASVSDTPST